MGKKRIDIEKIQDTNRRHVCFSKRRAGLFKKASELAILCDAEIAIVVFSSAGNEYVFGQPSADAVIHRYLSRKSGQISEIGSMTPSNTTGGQYWLDTVDIEAMKSLGELEQFLEGLKGLEERILARVDVLSRDDARTTSNSSNPFPSTVELPMSEPDFCIDGNPNLSMVEVPTTEPDARTMVVGGNPNLSMMQVPTSEPAPLLEFHNLPYQANGASLGSSPYPSTVELPISETPLESRPYLSMPELLISGAVPEFSDQHNDTRGAFGVCSNPYLSTVEQPTSQPLDIFSDLPSLDLGSCSRWIFS